MRAAVEVLADGTIPIVHRVVEVAKERGKGVVEGRHFDSLYWPLTDQEVTMTLVVAQLHVS